ncbi:MULTISPECIES: hypothetical protein [unclassified Clostridioides]|uniref:hypothetical protein n=1 Tax=unclassified Clostridioides TaxID=2635829 RepID=UPI0038AC874E
MSLFGSKITKEEKEKNREETAKYYERLKNMTKEEKKEYEIQEFMKKYQLENLDEKDLIVLKRIASDLFGNGLIKTGMALSFTDAKEQAKIGYLSALTEQNWMIIRQLAQLNTNIEKLIEDKKE